MNIRTKVTIIVSFLILLSSLMVIKPQPVNAGFFDFFKSLFGGNSESQGDGGAPLNTGCAEGKFRFICKDNRLYDQRCESGKWEDYLGRMAVSCIQDDYKYCDDGYVSRVYDDIPPVGDKYAQCKVSKCSADTPAGYYELDHGKSISVCSGENEDSVYVCQRNVVGPADANPITPVVNTCYYCDGANNPTGLIDSANVCNQRTVNVNCNEGDHRYVCKAYNQIEEQVCENDTWESTGASLTCALYENKYCEVGSIYEGFSTVAPDNLCIYDSFCVANGERFSPGEEKNVCNKVDGVGKVSVYKCPDNLHEPAKEIVPTVRDCNYCNNANVNNGDVIPTLNYCDQAGECQYDSEGDREYEIRCDGDGRSFSYKVCLSNGEWSSGRSTPIQCSNNKICNSDDIIYREHISGGDVLEIGQRELCTESEDYCEVTNLSVTPNDTNGNVSVRWTTISNLGNEGYAILKIDGVEQGGHLGLNDSYDVKLGCAKEHSVSLTCMRNNATWIFDKEIGSGASAQIPSDFCGAGECNYISDTDREVEIKCLNDGQSFSVRYCTDEHKWSDWGSRRDCTNGKVCSPGSIITDEHNSSIVDAYKAGRENLCATPTCRITSTNISYVKDEFMNEYGKMILNWSADTNAPNPYIKITSGTTIIEDKGPLNGSSEWNHLLCGATGTIKFACMNSDEGFDTTMLPVVTKEYVVPSCETGDLSCNLTAEVRDGNIVFHATSDEDNVNFEIKPTGLENPIKSPYYTVVNPVCGQEYSATVTCTKVNNSSTAGPASYTIPCQQDMCSVSITGVNRGNSVVFKYESNFSESVPRNDRVRRIKITGPNGVDYSTLSKDYYEYTIDSNVTCGQTYEATAYCYDRNNTDEKVMANSTVYTGDCGTSGCNVTLTGTNRGNDVVFNYTSNFDESISNPVRRLFITIPGNNTISTTLPSDSEYVVSNAHCGTNYVGVGVCYDGTEPKGVDSYTVNTGNCTNQDEDQDSDPDSCLSGRAICRESTDACTTLGENPGDYIASSWDKCSLGVCCYPQFSNFDDPNRCDGQDTTCRLTCENGEIPLASDRCQYQVGQGITTDGVCCTTADNIPCESLDNGIIPECSATPIVGKVSVDGATCVTNGAVGSCWIVPTNPTAPPQPPQETVPPRTDCSTIGADCVGEDQCKARGPTWHWYNNEASSWCSKDADGNYMGCCINDADSSCGWCAVPGNEPDGYVRDPDHDDYCRALDQNKVCYKSQQTEGGQAPACCEIGVERPVDPINTDVGRENCWERNGKPKDENGNPIYKWIAAQSCELMSLCERASATTFIESPSETITVRPGETFNIKGKYTLGGRLASDMYGFYEDPEKNVGVTLLLDYSIDSSVASTDLDWKKVVKNIKDEEFKTHKPSEYAFEVPIKIDNPGRHTLSLRGRVIFGDQGEWCLSPDSGTLTVIVENPVTIDNRTSCNINEKDIPVLTFNIQGKLNKLSNYDPNASYRMVFSYDNAKDNKWWKQYISLDRTYVDLVPAGDDTSFAVSYSVPYSKIRTKLYSGEASGFKDLKEHTIKTYILKKTTEDNDYRYDQNGPQVKAKLCKQVGESNLDNIVDDADFDVWFDIYIGGMYNPSVDFNGDGTVNLVDYQIWWDTVGSKNN